MAVAFIVADRATCDRKHVGAVITKNNRVIATGYNGAPSGMPHCDDENHLMAEIDGRQSCIRTLHAESNALDFAGRDARGAKIYTTVIPCYDCAKRIINAGIIEVIYSEYYESRKTALVEDLFGQAAIPIRQV